MTTSTPNPTAVSTEPGLESAWWALRLGIGLTAFALAKLTE